MNTFRFADIELLRYRVPDFESLPLQTKKYIFHLSEAALSGRDILYVQHHKLGLALRHLLEELYTIADPQDREYEGLQTYLYRVWFSSGIYHHYSERKFSPSFSQKYFDTLFDRLSERYTKRLEEAGLSRATATALIFDESVDPIRRANGDETTLIERSAVNFYDEGISTEEARDFYASIHEVIAPGLNSRLIKHDDGTLDEEVATTTGLYATALTQIVYHLRQAQHEAPSEELRELLQLLIDYYEQGELSSFYHFSVKWVTLHDPCGVDFINGFIETYTDPLGLKGSWEAIVQLIDREGSHRTTIIAEKASHFEQLSPIDEAYKKGEIKGVSASAINVVMLGGDSYPASPLGINLPNDEGIRAEYGSKSVTLTNISQALDDASAASGIIEAFYHSKEVCERMRKYSHLTGMLHTDLHECLGHGSGKLLPGITGSALEGYDSTIEEARADLNGLYFIADREMIDLGLLPDDEAFKAEYDHFFTNAILIQLARLDKGEPIMEAHMQDRALIARYILDMPEATDVIRLEEIEGHHYVVIYDYHRLRDLIGLLLREIQRIKSCGDIATAKDLIEKYGMPVSPELWQEVSQRYQALGLSPYRGFLNPRMTAVREPSGEISEVTLDYEESYEEQMRRYSRDYAFLPIRTPKVDSADGIWLETLNGVRRQLHRNMDGVVSASMRAKGINYRINFGVTLPRLKSLAENLPKEVELGSIMWSKEVREMKILATMVIPPDRLPYESAREMCLTTPYIEISEQLAINLLLHTPYVERLTLSLWAEQHPHTSQAAVIPYILMTRMLMSGSLGYELYEPLLKYASRDLTTPPSSLSLYMLNALRRLAESGERGRAMIHQFVQSERARGTESNTASSILRTLEETIE